MRLHPDMRVIRPGRGGRQQNERGVQPRRFVRLADQFFPDPLALIRHIDGEVAEIRAVGEVSNGPRDADEFCAIAGGDEEIRMGQHAGDGAWIVHRPPLRQRGTPKHVNEFGGGELRF